MCPRNEQIKLYQDNPEETSPMICGRIRRSFTDSIGSNIAAGNKEFICLMGLFFSLTSLIATSRQYALTLEFTQSLDIKGFTSLFTKACRKMRSHGITAYWHWDVCVETGLPHLHGISFTEVKFQVIQSCLPEGIILQYCEPVKCLPSYLKYMFKLPVINDNSRDELQLNNDEKKPWALSRDKWASKRLLFKKSLGLRQVQTTGKFWIIPKKTLWEAHKDLCARVSELRDDEQLMKELRQTSKITKIKIKSLLFQYAKENGEAHAKQNIEQAERSVVCSTAEA
jgi:hypothetical protein